MARHDIDPVLQQLVRATKAAASREDDRGPFALARQSLNYGAWQIDDFEK